MESKLCSRCNIEKRLSYFHKDKYSKDGYLASCKKCRKDYYLTRSFSVDLLLKEKKCNVCKKKYTIDNFSKCTKNKDGLQSHCKQCNKQLRYKRVYGITIEDYETMFELQDGKCAICGKEETNKRNNYMLSIDHNHNLCKEDDGYIRGLLCNHCNQGLGNFKDNILTLKKAILYLQ